MDDKSSTPEKVDRRGLKSFESRAFVALLFVTTIYFIWIVRYFLPPVFWAVIFAILFQPVYVRIRELVRGRDTIAALLTTLVVIVLVGIPATLLLTAVGKQGLAVYQRFVSGDINFGAPLEFVERVLPRLTSMFERYGVDADRIRIWLQDAAVNGSQWIATRLLSFGQNTLMLAVLFLLMLYILFFLFRDGDRILHGLIRALPMGDAREVRLFRRFAEVSRATVKGTLVVAVVQGGLGGALFAIVGIQAAVFWGMLMGVLSLLPAVGPSFVWVPAAIYLFATGSIGKGLILTIGGTLVVSLVDNVLRPVLVGREAKMPDYLVLIATLGGLTAFGIAGFVAGPVIAALVLVMWEMFTEEYVPLESSGLQPQPAAAGAARTIPKTIETTVPAKTPMPQRDDATKEDSAESPDDSRDESTGPADS